jgi:hypothetical protein
MTEIKSLLSNLCNPVGESTMIQYHPILKYAGLDLEHTLVLSYVLGWNTSGRVCFISKDKISSIFQIPKDEIEDIIASLVKDDFLTVKETSYRGSKSKAFIVNLEKITNTIISNDEYVKTKGINEYKEKIKQLEKGIVPEEISKDTQKKELDKILKAVGKKLK